MVDHWERGWRKLVEWDKKNKIYKYKGHNIIPLSFEEQRDMPMHLQGQYYWGEIEWIDRIIESKEKSKNSSQSTMTVNEALDLFFKELEEME